jgi:DNA invertase Pin-like site-specific DNA recombinase
VTHTTDVAAPPTTGMRFGYTRVSTVAQTLHQQHDALKAAGVSKVFSDTMWGREMIAPALPP